MRARTWGVATVLVSCAALELWQFADQCIDDAFISFRYADNLVRHGRLTYNLGEPPVEGFSNPLWVLLNVPGALLGSPLAWARAIGAACLAANAWLIARLSVRAYPARSGSVALALSLCLSAPGFVYWHCAGLETPLVGLCVTLALYLFHVGESEKSVLLGPVLAALALTRIDAALTALVVLGACVLVYGFTRARLKRAAVAASWLVFALGALEVARFLYFGQLLPNTYYAKVDGHLFDDARAGLSYVLTPFEHAPLLLIGLSLPVWSRPSQRHEAPILWVCWIVLLVQLVYIVAVGGDWMPLYRFFAPFVPLAALLAMATLQRLLDKARALCANEAWLLGLCAIIAPGGVLGYLTTDAPLSVQMGTELTELGRDLGVALTKALPESTWTANGAAGSAPYHARLDNIDLGGLTDRAIAHTRVSRFASFLPKGHRKGDGRYVLSRAPEVLVFVQGRSKTPGFHPADAQIAFDPRFHAHYELAELNAERRATRAGWVLFLPEQGRGFLKFAALDPVPTVIGMTLVRRPRLDFQIFRRTPVPASGVRPLFAHVAQLAENGKERAAAEELANAARRKDMGPLAPLAHPMIGYLYVRAGDLVRASNHMSIAQRVLPPEWMELFHLWLRTDHVFEPLVASSIGEEGD